MFAYKSETETQPEIVKYSVLNLVWQASHLGVEEATVGEERLGSSVHAEVHPGLRKRESFILEQHMT